MAPNNKVSVADAVKKAMALAQQKLPAWLPKNPGKRYDCGNDADFVYTEELSTLKSNWEKAKRFTHGGVNYDGKLSVSSGENKYDLRLVPSGSNAAVYNYHVFFKKDSRAEDAAKQQSAADKKLAAAAKEEQQKKEDAAKKAQDAAALAKKAEDEQKKKRDQALATAWNALKTKPKDKAAWVKDWLEKNKNRKF